MYQRLNVGRPIDGWFGDWAVRLIDVSATGALLEADEPIPDASRALLRFWWRGTEVEITAETARHDDLRCGVRFLEDSATLRRLIADEATAVLRAQQANADGDRAANVIGEETLTAASAISAFGFVTYTLADGRWKKRPALSRDQPADGFTVAAGESEDQIQLLCQTYEKGDGEARRLTRLLAELSVGG
ncbi:MAG TPA: PilZ domain-containing protein [Thermoanaerobaculia bacterium]